MLNSINDAGVVVFRAKGVDDIERSYVLHPNKDPMELRYPGSVVTVLRDIDKDGKIVGYYDLPDGRRQGCLISPTQALEAEKYSNVFMMDLTKGFKFNIFTFRNSNTFKCQITFLVLLVQHS